MREVIAEGDTISLIMKFLSHEQSKEREEAVSLLYELSKSKALCEKIGDVNGEILILVGMTSSNSENVLTVEKAKEMCNIWLKMEDFSLFSLSYLKQWLHIYLGELVLSNDVKVVVTRRVGSSLVNVMRSGNMQSREVATGALNQISFSDASAKVLIEARILPPLVKDLFTVGANQLPARLKEISPHLFLLISRHRLPTPLLWPSSPPSSSLDLSSYSSSSLASSPMVVISPPLFLLILRHRLPTPPPIWSSSPPSSSLDLSSYSSSSLAVIFSDRYLHYTSSPLAVISSGHCRLLWPLSPLYVVSSSRHLLWPLSSPLAVVSSLLFSRYLLLSSSSSRDIVSLLLLLSGCCLLPPLL
ncbi:hypothetical protein IFM89_035861 [Coptis chinensis]|uniref:ARM repeat superfamily protein n=1 Tax=Coptis chinensis TaxID=261450 RepID=A0A835LCL8_9MAGN|nr:hypothetical protein IFM89_035861 [Coptis chinensis]